MDSPLILIIIWALINVFIKSANDKKKIEEAKRKKTQKLGKQTHLDYQKQYENRNTTAKNDKSIIDIFKEEIEKEIQREKHIQQPIIPSETKKITVIERTPNEEVGYKDVQREIPVINEVEVKKNVGNINSRQRQVFNSQSDILKGIMYAEILSEPKSIKNMKRSM